MIKTKTAYTPGPWITKPPVVYGIHVEANGKWIATVEGDHETNGVPNPGFPSNKECEANATLIATAPELLEVAKGALGYLNVLPASHRPDKAWLEPLLKAIEKAEGK